MITKLIPIGNSLGIRIPKTLIQQYDLTGTEIELHAAENGILIAPVKKSRQNWEEMFKKGTKKMQIEKEDNIDVSNTFDETEWTW
jgi:antitoxin MazE